MKKLLLILTILFISTICFSQAPKAPFQDTRILTNEKTMVIIKGGVRTDSAFVIPHFADTTAANRGANPKYYPRNMIHTGTTGDSVWIRSQDTLRWTLLTGTMNVGGALCGQFDFSTSTSASDPGNGNLRLDNATYASVTNVYISEQGAVTDVSQVLASLSAGDFIYMQDEDDASKFVRLKLSGAGTDNGTWWTLPVTFDASGGSLFGNNDDLTVCVTFGSPAYTDEQAQDAVGNILIDDNTFDFTYNDGIPSITGAVRTQMSITSDANGIKLSGDATSPGNTKLYGTNGSGTKGWYDQPTGTVTAANNGTRLSGTTVKLDNGSNPLTENVTIDGLTNTKRIFINGKGTGNSGVDIYSENGILGLTSNTGVYIGQSLVDSAYIFFAARTKFNTNNYPTSFSIGSNKDAPGINLQEISSNQTVTFPVYNSDGYLLLIHNQNTSANSWLVSGAVCDPDGTAITSIPNQSMSWYRFDKTTGSATAGKWVRFSGGGSTGGGISGTGAANRIAYWNGASSLTSSANNTFDGSLQTITANSLGTTQDESKGFLLDNTTAAADGAQQISPAIQWRSHGWATGAAESRNVEFRAYVLPTQGSPLGTWKLQSSIADAAFNDALTVDNTGSLTASNQIMANGNLIGKAGEFQIAANVVSNVWLPFSGAYYNGDLNLYHFTSRTLSANRFGALNYMNGSMTEASSGVHPVMSLFGLFRPTIINGSATHDYGATFYINGSPVGQAAAIDNYSMFVDSGSVRFDGRILKAQGDDVASVAGAIALTEGNAFEITGTNAITLISNVGWINGSEVTLWFTSTASLTDGTANSGTDIGMELNGNTNFTGSAGASLTLQLIDIGGTQRWREKCRSVN